MNSGPQELDEAGPRPLPPGQRRDEQLQVRHYGRVPRVHLPTWTLTIGGATAAPQPTTLSWAEFTALPTVEVRADHHCVSRHSVQDLTWSGVPARSIVELAAPADDARFVVAYAAYGYSSNITVDDLMSGRSLLATHLNGAPLTPEHGWPVRLIIPHLYGWKGPKWLVSLEYLREPSRGFWEQRGYHFTGDVWREERYSHQE